MVHAHKSKGTIDRGLPEVILKPKLSDKPERDSNGMFNIFYKV